MNLMKLSKNVRMLNASVGFSITAFCFFTALSLMSWNKVAGQSTLINNSFTHQVDFNGTYQDFVIPADITANRIEFFLDGGDGGRNGHCNTRGGRGARITAVFAIGTGTNQLKPGSTIRFIIGEQGTPRTGSDNPGGSGGGGGTGILYLKSGVTTTEETPSTTFSDENSKWVILAVAGGGGGAWARNSCSEEKNGSGGSTGTSGTSGGGSNDGGTDGNGGERGPGFDGGAGAGYLTNSTPLYGINGRKGGITGGEGGHDITEDPTFISGGFGYGGGGGGHDTNNGGGGGGGGFSGGGGGNDGASVNANNGGGGGSFVNGAAISNFTDINGNDVILNGEDGYATYIFRSQPNPVARCKDITVTLSGNYTLSVLDINDGSTVEPTEDIQTFGILTNVAGSLIPLPTRTLDCSDIGQKTLTVKIISTSGASATCTSTVTIRDNVIPVPHCTSFTIAAFVSPDAPYNLSINTVKNGATTDACGTVVNEYLSQSVFTCADAGSTHTVTLTAVDNSGNIGTCTANISVVAQSITPALVCPDDITVTLGPNDGCSANIAASALAPVTLDRACSNVLTNSILKEPLVGLSITSLGTDLVGGLNVVVGTATVSYQLSTNSTPLNCSFTVTVNRQNPNPTAICQDATVVLDGSGMGTLDASQVNNGSTDQCGISGINGLQLSKSNFTCADIGTHQVTLTVTNNIGTSSTCTANVTVEGSCQCYAGGVVYVDRNATGNENGTDWDNAFTTLRAATDFIAISGCSAINQIWVAQGTYFPDEGPGATNNDRGSTFTLVNNVAIYGGFNGTETMLSQRNWNLYPTLLSGDLMQNDGPNFTNNTDNAYHLFNLVGSGFTASAILDGFTLTAGFANGSGATQVGAAMRIANGADATIRNCKIIGNKADTQGGGAFVSSASASFSDCTFETNFAINQGGGLCAISNSSVILTDCIFRGNSVNLLGGAIYTVSSSLVLPTNCHFSGNKATDGAAYCTVNSGSTISAYNCSIAGNRATAGAAVSTSTSGTNSLANCIVWGNNAGIANATSGTTYVFNSIIQGGYSGPNVHNEDPLFVSLPDYTTAPTLAGDLHLQTCSPAIDAGVDNSVSNATDLDGYVRKFDAIYGNQQIDMGAYEFQQDLDLDDDGYSSCGDDCDDNNASIHAPVTYYVDGDNDGYGSTATAMFCTSTASTGYSDNNTDCDDNDAGVHAPLTYYVDSDNDGYGSTTSAMLCSSTAPTGYADDNTDCNDSNINIHAPQTYYVDGDFDGYGSTTSAMFCTLSAPVGYSTNNTDCNDFDTSVHSEHIFYQDIDMDGFGSLNTLSYCSLIPPPNFVTNHDDCDDFNADINPNTVWYLDADDDHYYTGSGVTQCEAPDPGSTYTGLLGGNDCNDFDASVHALSTFYEDNDGDDFGSDITADFCSINPPVGYANINGDCDDNDINLQPNTVWFLDADNDGYITGSAFIQCEMPGPGYRYAGILGYTDCNDNDATVHTSQLYYVDADQDGFGSTATAMLCSSTPTTGYSTNSLDCDDNNSAVNPTTVWYLDADNDNYYTGSGVTQCGSPGSGYKYTGLLGGNDCNDNPATGGAVHAPQTYFVDADVDGYGSTTSAMLCSSTAPTGYADNNTDCNDNDVNIHAQQLYYIDGDADGFGATPTYLCSLTAPAGYSSIDGDCNDGDGAINPNATEVCDNIDNDCDNLFDAADPNYVDDTSPEPVCLTTTVYLQPDGTYALQPEDVVDFNASFDNCGSVNVTTITPAVVDCSQLGQTLEVTVTTSDAKDNKADCTAHIIVQEGTDIPSPWASTDVGANANGFSTFSPCTNGGTFTLSAQGYTTNTTDVQHTVFQEICDNTEIIAHIANVIPTGGWAGIEIRESDSQGAKKFTLKTQLGSILRREIRNADFGPTNTQQIGIVPTHTWLRLVRSGNTFAAYSSADGSTWAFRSAASIPMNSCVMAGLFVESINNTTTATATIDHVFVNGGTPASLVASPTGASSTQAFIEMPQVRVYPNPSSGNFTIEINPLQVSDEEASWSVWDTNGNIVLQRQMPAQENRQTLDLSAFPDGVYWLRVQGESMLPVMRKIVKTAIPH